MNIADRTECDRFATEPEPAGKDDGAKRSARVRFPPQTSPGRSRIVHGGRSRERSFRNTAGAGLRSPPRIRWSAAPGATALTMVLPQELDHFSGFHGGVDADGRGGSPSFRIVTDDHPTTVGPLHDFGMVDFSHRSTPRQPLRRGGPYSPHADARNRRVPVGARRFRELPAGRKRIRTVGCAVTPWRLRRFTRSTPPKSTSALPGSMSATGTSGAGSPGPPGHWQWNRARRTQSL